MVYYWIITLFCICGHDVIKVIRHTSETLCYFSFKIYKCPRRHVCILGIGLIDFTGESKESSPSLFLYTADTMLTCWIFLPHWEENAIRDPSLSVSNLRQRESTREMCLIQRSPSLLLLKWRISMLYIEIYVHFLLKQHFWTMSEDLPVSHDVFKDLPELMIGIRKRITLLKLFSI